MEMISIEDDKKETAKKTPIPVQDEKLIKVKFMNIEDGEEDITFSFGKVGNVQLYHLHPGYVYELPESVVDHLNSIEKPTYKIEQDGFGNFRHIPAGTVNRFSCLPVK